MLLNSLFINYFVFVSCISKFNKTDSLSLSVFHTHLSRYFELIKNTSNLKVFFHQTMLRINVIAVLSCLFHVTHCQHYINSTCIESALQDWTLSSQAFFTSAGWSIVGYDEDKDKVIIFGGVGSDENFYTTDWYALYVYDIISDRLTHVSLSWDTEYYSFFMNYASTNAVIINSTMHFLITKNLLELDLHPIYSYIDNNPASGSPPQFKPIIWFDSSSQWYGGGGCIVTDSTKEYLIISGMICNRDVIVIHIATHMWWLAAQSNQIHFEGVCVVMDDVFYAIGGRFSNATEYIDITILKNEKAPVMGTYQDMLYYDALVPWYPRNEFEESYIDNESYIFKGILSLCSS